MLNDGRMTTTFLWILANRKIYNPVNLVFSISLCSQSNDLMILDLILKENGYIWQ